MRSFLVVLITLGVIRTKSHADPVIIDLGTLGGPTSSAFALNNSGQVVGESTTGGGGLQAFLYTNSMLNLGLGDDSTAAAITGSGHIAGTLTLGDFSQRAFLSQSGSTTILGNLIPGGSSLGYGVNNAATVVGTAETATGNHAFRWTSAGGMEDLGTLGGPVSTATAINDAGKIVGFASDATGTPRPFLYDAGLMLPLFVDQRGSAYAINDANQIVGERNAVAFLYSGGVTQSLGTLGGPFSTAYGINNGGQVVGTSGDQAFIWDSTAGMRSLNSLSAGSGWNLTTAYGINDQGWVVGVGINPSGQERSFLLQGLGSGSSSVPEPSSLLLLSLVAGGGACVAWKRRKKSA